MGTLLAVDLGVRTGLAVYGPDGRLQWYRSRNFGSAARLRQAVPRILGEIPGLSDVVLEGGGHLATIWIREAHRRNIRTIQTSADTWREELFYPRQHRSGPQAKHSADAMARRVIEWADAPRATSLRHDAAEAILVGLWGVLHTGQLAALPDELKPA